MSKLYIIQPKISDNHQDSVWYNGDIAMINDHYLVAFGIIKADYDGERFKGDNLAYHLLNNNKDDSELDNVEFHENNWFEIIYPDNESYTPDAQDYDGAIKELEAISKDWK